MTTETIRCLLCQSRTVAEHGDTCAECSEFLTEFAKGNNLCEMCGTRRAADGDDLCRHCGA